MDKNLYESPQTGPQRPVVRFWKPKVGYGCLGLLAIALLLGLGWYFLSRGLAEVRRQQVIEELKRLVKELEQRVVGQSEFRFL